MENKAQRDIGAAHRGKVRQEEGMSRQRGEWWKQGKSRQKEDPVEARQVKELDPKPRQARAR